MVLLPVFLLALSAVSSIHCASIELRELVPPKAAAVPEEVVVSTAHEPERKPVEISSKPSSLKPHTGKSLKIKPAKIAAPIDTIIGAQGFIGLGQGVEAKVLPVGRPISEVIYSGSGGVDVSDDVEEVFVPVRKGSEVVLVSLPGIVGGPHLGPQVGFHVARKPVEPTKKPLKKATSQE